MGALTDQANDVFRDFVTAGVPASGANDPAKSDIRTLFAQVDGAFATIGVGLSVGNSIIYGTQAQLFADLAHADGVLAIVFNDSVPSKDGIYIKSGASGSGSWLITNLLLPSSFAASLSSVQSDLATETSARQTGDANTAEGVVRWSRRGGTADDPLFSQDGAAVGYAINGNDGTTFATASSFTTDYIPVQPGGGVVCNIDLFGYAFYDINNVFLSGAQATGMTPIAAAGTTISVPADAFSFRTSASTADYDGIQIQPSGEFLVYRARGWAGSSMQNRSIGFFGDSNFERVQTNPNPLLGHVQPLVAAWLQAKDIIISNDGVSGRKMGATADAITLDAIGALDTIVIWSVHNDFANPDGGTVLGALGDATTAGTFYGDVLKAIDKIYGIKTDIQIFFCTQPKTGAIASVGVPAWNTPNGRGLTLEAYNDAVRNVCALYGIPVIDLSKDLSVNSYTYGTWSIGDNTHLNATVGAPRAAKIIRRRMF